MIKEAADAGKSTFPVDHKSLLLGIQLRPRHIERQISLLRETLQFGEERLVFRLGPRLDCAFVQCFRRIRNHQIQIEINRVAESLAPRARAIRIVEREQPRLRFFIPNIASFALEPLRKPQSLRQFAFVRSFKDHFARFAIADLHRINNPRPRIR